MQTIERVSIPIDFNLSQLKIRWSDHVLVKNNKTIVGEAVVYGGNWEKAERLARQIAQKEFGLLRGDLTVCEQMFISGVKDEGQRVKEKEINEIQGRHSNLKVKVGRNIFDDIKTLKYIRNELKFPYQIRIDANQAYSLEELYYLIPTLRAVGVYYIEEPTSKEDLPRAIRLLHECGIEVILDETIQKRDDWEYAVKHHLLHVLNLKLARVGDLDESVWYIKQAKKHGIKIIVGCSEDLERGMQAIYALGHIAKKEGVLLEVEGFGPLRLKRPARSFPRLVNRVENTILLVRHRAIQIMFYWWWHAMRVFILLLKKSRAISSLSLHLVKWTGKHQEKIHPKHLLSNTVAPEYMRYINKKDIVLDIGCGNGQHALRIAKIAQHVTGFDLDRSQLVIARRQARDKDVRNVTFERRSAEEKFPYPSQSFDRVIFLAVLEHLHHRDQILNEVHRVLKKNGTLFLGIPNEETSWKMLQQRFGISHYTDADHKVEYTKKTISDVLESHDFSVEKISPTALDTPISPFIDVVGGISFLLYRKLVEWKWAVARKNPRESTSFLVIAKKK